MSLLASEKFNKFMEGQLHDTACRHRRSLELTEIGWPALHLQAEAWMRVSSVMLGIEGAK